MPRYEFRCRACGDTFLLTRPMSESRRPATCPQGHDDTVKLLSTVAVGGRASSAPSRRSAVAGAAAAVPAAAAAEAFRYSERTVDFAQRVVEMTPRTRTA